MRVLLITLILAYTMCLGLLSGQSSSQLWLTGVNEFPGVNGFGNYILRLQGDSVLVESSDLKMNFESTMAAVADSNGQLLFYTNGCHIAAANGDTMLNGAGINPGDVADWVCPTSGYISPLGATVLQGPGSEHLFYLLHMGVRYEENKRLEFGPLYFSVVDMNLENGKGAVVSKNNVLLSGQLEPYSTARHGNGRDWWVMVAEYGTNRYHRFLFSPNGIVKNGEQELGPNLSCRHAGSTAFSPDGRRFGRMQDCKVLVCDFDRCTGLLSNPIDFNMPPNAFGGGGTAFSPDGNRLFVSTQLSVMQVDLTASNPTLDTVVSWLEILGSSLGYMQYTPGRRIFISNMSRAQYFHSIDTPDASNAAIGFHFRGQSLPAWNVRTLPNHPNFQLLDMADSPCDTLGITSVTDKEFPGIVSLRPNPANEVVHFSYHVESPANMYIYDARGIMMVSKSIPAGETRDSFDVASWPRGIYSLVVMVNNYPNKVMKFLVL